MLQNENEARCELAAAHRLAVMDGLNEGTWNHLSVVSPEDPEHMLVSPGDTHWSQVCASNLTLMGAQDTLISGPPANPAAWIIHYPVHRARQDAKCVMHVHTPYATALCMRKNWKLDTQSCQAAAHFHGDVAYFDVYDGSLRDEDEGERMADALGDKRVLMLRNHGVLIAGPTVGAAYADMYILERACMFQLLAAGDGVELNQIPEEVATEIGTRGRNAPGDGHFAGMKRLLDQRQPDYVN